MLIPPSVLHPSGIILLSPCPCFARSASCLSHKVIQPNLIKLVMTYFTPQWRLRLYISIVKISVEYTSKYYCCQTSLLVTANKSKYWPGMGIKTNFKSIIEYVQHMGRCQINIGRHGGPQKWRTFINPDHT